MTLKGTEPAVMLPKVMDLVRRGQVFVMVAHENADGDALGAQIALYHALRALGKEAHVVNTELPMSRYAFLDGGIVEVFDPALTPKLLARTDVVFVVDNNSWRRLGALEKPLKSATATVVCVDHHIADEPFSAYHLIQAEAAATTEIVLTIVDAMGIPLTRDLATAIYTGICTDTGWFRYSNTTPRIFDICTRLLAAGVDPERVNAEVNYQDNVPRQRLLARVLEQVEVEKGIFAHGFVSQAMMRDLDVSMADTDDFIDFIRGIRGVKIAAIFKEHRDGKVKVSLRSREDYSANAVAKVFGGGGHFHASGLTHDGPLAVAREAVLAEVRRRYLSS